MTQAKIFLSRSFTVGKIQEGNSFQRLVHRLVYCFPTSLVFFIQKMKHLHLVFNEEKYAQIILASQKLGVGQHGSQGPTQTKAFQIFSHKYFLIGG